jgi:radical SAM protein with 4Fe4S-binding SPASM domain
MSPARSKDLIHSARRALVPPYQHAQRQLHDLRMLVFEVTQRCNLTCRHCGSDCTSASGVPDLPRDKVLEVLSEVAEAYDPKRITVMIGGGEPLLYEGLWELGRQIRKLGFPWGMVTNGSLWTEATLEQARRAGARSISVSLDGPKDAHEWLRGKDGDFDTVLATVKRLIAAEWLNVMDVITVVHPRNVDRLEETWEIMRDIGAPGWRLIPISPIGRAKTNRSLLLDTAQFQRLLTTIMELRQRSELPVYLSESNYMGAELDLRVRDHHYFCRAGISFGGVMVDGAILACASIDRRFRQGNVFEDSFVDVWENRFELFRDRRWMKTERCSGCDEWRHCQGNSFHNWDLDANAPGACQFHDHALGEIPLVGEVPLKRTRPGPRRRR